MNRLPTPPPAIHRPTLPAGISLRWAPLLLLALLLAGCSTAARWNPVSFTSAHWQPPRVAQPEPLLPRADLAIPERQVAQPPAGESDVKILYPEDPAYPRIALSQTKAPLVLNEGAGRKFSEETGKVSYYNHRANAREKAAGPLAVAAHRTLPVGTVVRCTRLDTGSSVLVTIAGTGPFIKGRIIDLCKEAARQMDMFDIGVAPCKIEVVAYPFNYLAKSLASQRSNAR